MLHYFLSYFAPMGHEPPTLCIGITRNRSESKKDTFANIEENKEFVVNIIGEWMVESANHCSGNFPPEVDEVSLGGFTTLPSTLIAPPRIAESAFQMECRLTDVHHIRNDKGVITSSVVFGRVVMFHVHAELVDTGPRGAPQVKWEGYRPIGRLGGDRWVKLGDAFDIGRPKV